MSCRHCGATLPRASRADRVYCSGRCRVSALRTRRRMAQSRVVLPKDVERGRRLQLAQYRQVIATTGGTEWMRAKTAELEAYFSHV